MADIVLRNVHAYGPEDLGVLDIALQDGKIAAMGKNLAVSSQEEIDAAGLIALPGLIETHAHMLLPFAGTQTMNDFYDGTQSGLHGAVTCLVDFADQKKGASVYDALEKREQQAKDSVVDYSFHITLTDINEETLQAIPKLIDQGYVSFKFYTTYSDGGLFVPEDDMRRAFSVIAKHGGLATVHAEREEPIVQATKQLIEEKKTSWAYFPNSKPPLSEAEAIETVIALAKETNCPVLIRHISSEEGMALVETAQKEGVSVFGETCPHYLFFTDDVYKKQNAADYIVHPPIRKEKDKQALWRALQSDVVLTIGTDDCAFYKRQKRNSDKFYEVPGGMPGIETRFFVLYELGVAQGKIDHSRFACITSSYPAQIYGLYPQKGCLAVGSDADIILLDPAKQTKITAELLHEKSDYTPFEGFEASVELVSVFEKGRRVLQEGKCLAQKGDGQRILRKNPRKLGEIE